MSPRPCSSPARTTSHRAFHLYARRQSVWSPPPPLTRTAGQRLYAIFYLFSFLFFITIKGERPPVRLPRAGIRGLHGREVWVWGYACGVECGDVTSAVGLWALLRVTCAAVKCSNVLYCSCNRCKCDVRGSNLCDCSGRECGHRDNTTTTHDPMHDWRLMCVAGGGGGGACRGGCNHRQRLHPVRPVSPGRRLLHRPHVRVLVHLRLLCPLPRTPLQKVIQVSEHTNKQTNKQTKHCWR